jgi:deazaflavin-dependent oxidoreductase (nitroreductase family)
MKKIDVDQTVLDLEAGKTPEWITEHLRVYRESGGSAGHLFDASLVGGRGLVPSLLLTTKGRRSGVQRTSPLFYGSTASGYVVVGSKGEANTQPGWFLNLLADPVKVQVGAEHFTARARIATTQERSQLWEQMVELSGVSRLSKENAQRNTCRCPRKAACLTCGGTRTRQTSQSK